MKNVLLMLILISASFIACHDDHSSHRQDNFPAQAVEASFWAKYPSASNVESERKGIFQQVDFVFQQTDYEAWFNTKGVWLQTEYSSSYSGLPVAVKNRIINNINYPLSIWTPEESVNVTERKDYLTWYGVEMNNGSKEVTVWVQADGNREYDTVEDFDGGDIPQAIRNYLVQNYSEGYITEVFQLSDQSYQANLLDGDLVKTVSFNREMNWTYSEWPVLWNNVPQVVKSVLDAPAYKDFGVENVSYQQYPSGEWYHVTLQKTGQGNMATHVNIDPQGKIVL